MLSLQKAFNQLRQIVSTTVTVIHAGNGPNLAANVTANFQRSISLRPPPQPVSKVCACWHSTHAKSEKEQVKSYDPPSPYRVPGPRRYGYEPKMFTGGLLPRGDERPVRSLSKYRPKDSWNRKRALFGQNDYIDILGDGSIRPVDLIHGPEWLIGFKGNELQRLVRRVNFQGDKLKLLYPSKYHKIQKRIFFLHKKYNQRRGRRVTSQ